MTDYVIVRDINWRGASRLERDKKEQMRNEMGEVVRSVGSEPPRKRLWGKAG